MAGLTRLVLLAHGSRDPRWRQPFERLADTLATELGHERVRLAYLEFEGPTLGEVASEAVSDGVATLRVLPLFISAGAHVRRDAEALAAAARIDGVDVEVLPAVGEDPRLADLLAELAREAVRR